MLLLLLLLATSCASSAAVADVYSFAAFGSFVAHAVIRARCHILRVVRRTTRSHTYFELLVSGLLFFYAYIYRYRLSDSFSFCFCSVLSLCVGAAADPAADAAAAGCFMCFLCCCC